jgi:spermidine/putrescine-binding protein
MSRVLTRREALYTGAGSAMAVYLAACGGGDEGSSTSTLTFKTWEDHFAPDQLRTIEAREQVKAKISFAEDNLTNFQQVERGVDLDIVSADAFWVPKFHEAGLIRPFQEADFPNLKAVYPVAREAPFYREGSDYLAFPYAWAPHLLFYDPAKVKTPPDSYEALLDPQYRGQIVLAKEPNDIMAKAGVATGAKQPFAMTTDEVQRAKEYLEELKPNLLKLAPAGTEEIRAFGEGGISSTILGFDLRVKEAGGPEAKPVLPRDGTIGFADGEMLVEGSPNETAADRFLNANNAPDLMAQRFLKYPHPYFNERAYKLLVDQGEQELADRMLYNRPELAFDEERVALVAPPPNQQEYTDAFNEVFGA